MDATILLVEDDPSIREITEMGLRDAGFDVRTAADGDQALARFHRDQPDLVVLDVMLPKRDGLEVCRRIRTDSSVPVVIVSTLVTWAAISPSDRDPRGDWSSIW